MLQITPQLCIADEEIEWSAVRSQGAGGQSVNKTASAVHLRFDVAASSLPQDMKQRLLALRDQRISKDGVVVIKAQQTRSQDQNRVAALERLVELLQKAAVAPRVRRATRTPRSAKRRRVDDKTRRGQVKALRQRVAD